MFSDVKKGLRNMTDRELTELAQKYIQQRISWAQPHSHISLPKSCKLGRAKGVSFFKDKD